MQHAIAELKAGIDLVGKLLGDQLEDLRSQVDRLERTTLVRHEGLPHPEHAPETVKAPGLERAAPPVPEKVPGTTVEPEGRSALETIAGTGPERISVSGRQAGTKVVVEPPTGRASEALEAPMEGAGQRPGPQEEPPARRREVVVGQRWLLIAGVIVTLFGVGYFLKYSADHDWIGPAGQLGLAYFAGIAAMVVGEVFRARERFRNFGLPIVGGGIAVAYFTTLAGYQLYHPAVLGQGAAFTLLVLVTIFACTLALLHDAVWLAVLGLIGGFSSPILFESISLQVTALMSYLAILNLGILAIAGFKRWKLLTVLGFGCTWLLFSIWFFSQYTDGIFWITLVFLNLFFLVYALGPFLFYLVHPGQTEPIGGVVLIALDALLAFLYCHSMISRVASVRAVTVVALAYAVLFVAMAWLLRTRVRAGERIISSPLILGVVFTGLAVALLLDGYWITIGWSLLAVAVLWLSLKIDSLRLWVVATVLLVLSTGKFLLHDYSEHFGFELVDFLGARAGRFQKAWLGRWLATAVVLGAILVHERGVRWIEAHRSWIRRGLAAGLLATFVILLFAALNLEVSAFFYSFARAARFAAISVLWALYAVALMVWGFLSNLSVLRKSAMGLFAATLIKIFVLDMAAISTPFRILSFVVLGLLLIGMSYLYYRFRERI